MTAKPLTWRKPSDYPCEMSDAELIADGIGGKYAIQKDRVCGFTLWWAHDEFAFVEAATVEAAQALAEADWQERFGELFRDAQPIRAAGEAEAARSAPDTPNQGQTNDQ